MGDVRWRVACNPREELDALTANWNGIPLSNVSESRKVNANKRVVNGWIDGWMDCMQMRLIRWQDTHTWLKRNISVLSGSPHWLFFVFYLTPSIQQTNRVKSRNLKRLHIIVNKFEHEKPQPPPQKPQTFSSVHPAGHWNTFKPTLKAKWLIAFASRLRKNGKTPRTREFSSFLSNSLPATANTFRGLMNSQSKKKKKKS